MGIFARNLHPLVTALVLGVAISLPATAETVTTPLYEQLRDADAADAARISREIEREWSRSGSTALDMLLRRGREALENDEIDVAIEHLTAVTDHAPDFAEGFHMRATAYYRAGMYGPALADLQRVLALNPRHYHALFGLGVMFREFGDTLRAEEAFRMVLDLNPHHEEAAKALESLKGEGAGLDL